MGYFPVRKPKVKENGGGMINMQDLGFFLFMQEQEEKQREDREVKENTKSDLVGEQAAQNEKQR